MDVVTPEEPRAEHAADQAGPALELRSARWFGDGSTGGHMRTFSHRSRMRQLGYLPEEHLGKPFFETLVTFITRSPLLAMVIEGPGDTWQVVRTITGATDPAVAAPGTIRGDLAVESPENLIHASDGAESAAREIALWFPEHESGQEIGE